MKYRIKKVSNKHGSLYYAQYRRYFFNSWSGCFTNSGGVKDEEDALNEIKTLKAIEENKNALKTDYTYY